MPGPQNPVTASTPIPPPLVSLAFGELREGRNVYLTIQALEFLQKLYASIQGGGGLIAELVLSLPSPGVVQAESQSLIQQAEARLVAAASVTGRMAAIEARLQGAEDLGRMLLGRPTPAATQATTSPIATSAPFVTSEVIAAAALVNVWNDAGAFHARNADTTAAITALHECHGFTSIGAGSGATMQVQFFGILGGLSGLTPGPAYLGATGAVTSTPNATAGQISQEVGIALSATSIWFAPQHPTGL